MNMSTDQKSEHTITMEEAQSALDKWRNAAASGDKAAVLDCYAPNAQLKGTVWDHIVTNPEGRDGYFTHFLEGKQNISVRLDDDPATTANETAIRMEGLYTFCFEDEDGNYNEVPAHYSFCFAKNEAGEAEIIEHFSSKRASFDSEQNFDTEQDLLQALKEETFRRTGLSYVDIEPEEQSCDI